MRPTVGLGASKRMGRLDGGKDTFRSTQRIEGGQRIRIRSGTILSPADRVQKGMFRAHRRIIEPCRNRLSLLNLAMRILEQERVAPMQDTGLAVDDGGRMLSESIANTTSLDTNDLDTGITQERMK